MAESDSSSFLETLNMLLNNSGDVTKTIQGIGDVLKEAMMGSGSLEGQLKSLSGQLSNTNEGFGKNSNSTATLARNMLGASAVLSALTTENRKGSQVFGEFSKAGSTAAGSMAEYAEELGSFKSKLTDVFNALGNNSPLAKFGAYFSGAIDDIVKSTARVQGMEQGIVSLGAATGDLDGIFGEDGGLAKNIDQTFQKFNDDIFKTAEATGLGVKTITTAAKELGKVPDALRTSVSAGTQAMSELVAATKIAAATGQDITSVTNQISRAYENLNLKGQDAVDFLSSVADASSKLHLPLDLTSTSIEGLANKYAFLTNNTDGAIKAFARFVPALQNAGLSPKQSIEMFNQMSESISKMGTAEKAFLAQRSGIGSGLQGAFKIDKLVQDGKMDEVMKMMQDNLQRQFGGRTVTLDDASSNQRDAVQYQRQLQYLKNGAFGNLVKDDQQASKLFKAMQSGDFQKEGTAVLTGNAATQEVTARGSAMQDRNRTVVGTIATQVQKIASIQDQQLALLAKNTIGTASGSPIGQTLKDLGTSAMAESAMNEKPMTVDARNNIVDQLMGVLTTSKSLYGGYMGPKDQFGHNVKEQEKVPAAHGPTLGRSESPLDAAMRQSVEGSNARSSISPETLKAATDNKEGTASSSRLANTPTNIQVTGKLEGICLNCKTQMDVGHIHNAVTDAANKVAEQGRQRIGSPIAR